MKKTTDAAYTALGYSHDPHDALDPNKVYVDIESTRENRKVFIRKLQHIKDDWYMLDGTLVHSGYKFNVIQRQDGKYACGDCGTVVPDEVMILFKLEKFRTGEPEVPF